MGADGHLDWQRLTASALEWWHDAGVDVIVDDAPRDWLAALHVPQPVPAASQVADDVLPGELAAFLRWRSGDQAPDHLWRGVAIEASGPADADYMVLVDCPDRDDDAAGLLSKGAAGALFGRMLAAIGLSRDEVHIAAVCLRRPPPGRMAGEVEARLGELARHHVALVAPRRLLVLGDGASRAVLGTNIMAARDGLRPFNHEAGLVGAGETQVVASFHPRLLLERPAAKAEAWRDLQALVSGMETDR